MIKPLVLEKNNKAKTKKMKNGKWNARNQMNTLQKCL